MSTLQSPRFAGDPILEACLNGQHRMLPPESGEAVKKVQRALRDLGFPLPLTFANGDADGQYGNETAQAVSAFKRSKSIEPSDGVVGPKTMAALDALFLPAPQPQPPPPPPSPPAPTNQQVIQDAFDRSRRSLRVVLDIMRRFEEDIDRANQLSGNDKILAIVALGKNHARDLAVISDKLKTSLDPLSPEFRDALRNARELTERNLAQSSNIIDQGSSGRCDPNQFKNKLVPFAATRTTDPDPRVSACAPFFSQNDEMKRDVITHEFFHLVGLADVESIRNTADALNDANTMAQIIAYLHDRFRQQDSSGLSQPPFPYPMP